MRFYSDKLNKPFDTEDELLKAEADFDSKVEEENKKLEEVKEKRDAAIKLYSEFTQLRKSHNEEIRKLKERFANEEDELWEKYSKAYSEAYPIRLNSDSVSFFNWLANSFF